MNWKTLNKDSILPIEKVLAFNNENDSLVGTLDKYKDEYLCDNNYYETQLKNVTHYILISELLKDLNVHKIFYG